MLKLCVNRARKTQMRIQKTAHYRFADISYGENQNSSIQSSWSFEQHLNHCKLQYLADTFPTFEFFEQSECLIASHETINGKTRIHLIIYEQGAGAAVVATLQDSIDVEIKEALPPNDREFIEAQLFIICEDNHVLWVSHNKSLRVGTIQNVMKQLFDAYLNQPIIPDIFLLAMADTDQFANLLNDGVSSIEMDFFGYREAYEYAKQNEQVDGAGFFSNLMGIIKSDAESSDAMDRMKTRVSLKPGRNYTIPSIKAHLESVANSALNNVDKDNEVTIVTKTGIRIKSSSLMVRKNISVSGDKRILDIGETFSSLEEGYTHLQSRNLLTDR